MHAIKTAAWYCRSRKTLKKKNLIIMKKTHTFSFVVAIPAPAYETSACLSYALRSA